MSETIICKDCKKSFEINPDVPLEKLIAQGIIPGNHVWYSGKKYGLRHQTRSEWIDGLYDNFGNDAERVLEHEM